MTQSATLSLNTIDYPFETLAQRAQAIPPKLILDPDFQRKYKWDKDGWGRESKFIESCLMRIPLPSCYFAKNDTRAHLVIDGVQRITTIIRFMNNEFALEGMTAFKELEGKKFSELGSLAADFESTTIRCVVLKNDPLFYDNQNVFIKSYLVSACSILEALLQDLASNCAAMMRNKVNALNLPFNFINWVAEHDKANLKFVAFVADKASKDISDMLSPNYHKTITTFRRIGVDIVCDDVVSHEDYISSIVEKLNKIVHQNDTASDLSFPGIITAIDKFKTYSACLYTVVSNNPHLVA